MPNGSLIQAASRAIHARLAAGLVLTVSLTACGGGGQATGPAGSESPAPASPPATGLSLRTTVRMDPFFYHLPPLPPCLSAVSSLTVPTLATGFKVDGSLAGWANVPPLVSDPAGDAPPGFDLTTVSAALAGADLAVSATLVTAAAASINIELGGIVAHRGVVHGDVRRLFRVYQGALQVYQSGAWQAVAATDGQAAVGPGGTELRLSQFLVGDVMTWPLWWVRVYTRDESRGLVADSTEAVYFPSVLGPDNPDFAVDRCDLWGGRATPLALLELHDAQPGVAPARAYAGAALTSTSSWTPPSPNWPSLEERAFQLARAAYDAVQALLGGEPLPVASLAVLTTADAVSDLVDSVGVGDAYGGPAAAYRALIVDIRSLAPASTAGFAEGPIFERFASALLDLVLRSRLSTAPPLLVKAVRQALLDQLDNQTLGASYFLDQFQPTVAALLTPDGMAASDAAAPGPLTPAKAIGFGHLLAAEVDAKTLLAAWKAAATGAAAGVSPEAALRAALIAARSGDAGGQDRISRLWQGWLSPAAYDPGDAPAMLADHDADGVPDYLEVKAGTRPDLADSVGDGWSDLARLILGANGKNGGSSPDILVPDGDFGDWQRLMPRRLVAGRGQPNPACPKAATIAYYAALADHDTLLIGAYAQDFLASEPAARWEVDLDFIKDQRQVLLTAAGNAYTYNLLDGSTRALLKTYRRAFPVARQTFEVAIARSALFLGTNLDDPGALQLQMRTVYTDKAGDHICDQTDWIAPYTTSD